jgi:hypothetical protein
MTNTIITETDPIPVIIESLTVGPQGPPGEDGAGTAVANYEKQVFEDGFVSYYCLAELGSLPNSPVWQVKKIDFSDGEAEILLADGDLLFDNLATDLATVKALTYI